MRDHARKNLKSKTSQVNNSFKWLVVLSRNKRSYPKWLAPKFDIFKDPDGIFFA